MVQVSAKYVTCEFVTVDIHPTEATLEFASTTLLGSIERER